MNVFLSLILLCIAIIHNGLVIEYYYSVLIVLILGLFIGIPLFLTVIRWNGNFLTPNVHYLLYYFSTAWIMGAIS